MHGKGTIGGIGDLRGSYANNEEWVIFCQKGRKEFQYTKLLENKLRGGKRNSQCKEAIGRYKVGLLPAGLGRNIQKLLTMPCGRKEPDIPPYNKKCSVLILADPDFHFVKRFGDILQSVKNN